MSKDYAKVLQYFENNHFKNEGVWSRTQNLIFEFCDWLDTEDNNQIIADTLGLEWDEDIDNFAGLNRAKAEMVRDCEDWIGDPVEKLKQDLEAENA